MSALWSVLDTLTRTVYPMPNKQIAESVAEMHGDSKVVPGWPASMIDPPPRTHHDHTKEPKVWCRTCTHMHIASIPRFTYACKDCGWGQWYGQQALAHSLEHGHSTYEIEHKITPLTVGFEPIARIIWETSRNDEGGISVLGSNIIAKRIVEAGYGFIREATLDGETERPDEGIRVKTAGEFAAVWNSMDLARREVAVSKLMQAQDDAVRCYTEGHELWKPRPTTLTDEMVEAAAKALFEDPNVPFKPEWTWADVLEHEGDRADTWREDARRVLEAALAVQAQPPSNADSDKT